MSNIILPPSNGGIITPDQLLVHERLFNDYEYFARHIQRIEPKDLAEEDPELIALQEAILGADVNPTPGMMPLIFQPGQLKLHHFVTDMKAKRGVVRCVLVKPRQVGWSTYIQGRFHWLATKTPAFKVFIISHNDKSTSKFLRRVRLLCKLAPDSITPGRNVENSKELEFDNLSTYGIATAGSPDAMRSDACHGLHASEVPFWKNLVDNLGAVIPALSDGRGSEGYLESTSKGKGTPWHQFVQACLAGETGYDVFFDAWFNHPKYRATPPEGWQPDAANLEAMQLYNLSLDQTYWRSIKAKVLRSEWLFKQEFPGTIEESFQSSEGTLINPDSLYRARKSSKLPDKDMPLILGVDPARVGDRTAIAARQGSVISDVDVYPKMDDMKLVGILAGYLNNGYKGRHVSMIFLDYAIGEGAASRLRELGHHMRIRTVHFGEGATEDRFLNKRAEMAVNFRDWFGDTGEHVSIPDRDDIQADILAIPDFTQATVNEKIKLVPKDEIKKENGGRSPDIFDACILTFAYPVAGERTREMQMIFEEHFSHITSVTELTSLLRDFAF